MSERRMISPAKALAVVMAAGVLLAAGCSSTETTATANGSAAAGLGTIEKGKLKVAIEPYMPYTDIKNGTMVGLDAEILQAAAGALGLRIETQMTDFKGMLNSVQSGRADVTIGGIGWSKDRAEKGLFTDPVYYSPAAMAVVGDKPYKTVDDLKGLRLGTVSGYVWEQSIKAVDGAQTKVYPDANGFFADLAAGRIDVGFIDPLLVTYQRQVQPNSKFQLAYLTPPTDAQIAAKPAFKDFRQIQVSFYLPKKSTALEKALDEQIDKLYQNGQLAAMVTKWGGDPNQFCKPDPYLETLRQGVDRPAGWKLPTI
ncbi:substrate-binding periplasmic protein [Paractinoplanes globisporus]|uniref:Substrate-binding periplasmic protein n=1 Tax=Paractinoplanes globisporus TaxID=113565 RepID=A0ABW6W9W6_9ACTN|nr:ABC transporter substrate-binding protein [Actinoplanes globisporus]